MGRTLCAYVHVAGQVFGPGDVPPPEVAEQIRNPKVWQVTPEPEEPAAAGGPVFGPGTETSDLPPAGPVSPPPVDLPPEPPAAPAPPAGPARVEEPPRSGRGSGRDTWAAFADQHGVTYPADAERSDIIAACVAAQVIQPG